jgi:protein-S-isoprenylcysteine O-methyltransferase Ste14
MNSIHNSKRDVIPLVMWIILFSGIVVLSIIRLIHLNDVSGYPVRLDALFIGLYLSWMLIELKITRRDVIAEDKTTADCMTCQFYGAGQALTILSALWFSGAWRSLNIIHLLGIGLFLTGVLYRLWAIRTLGRFYSHRVRTQSRHRIVVIGPYRFTRHPAYAGMIVANVGIAIYFFNQVTLGVLLILLVPAILLRIFIEEKTLFKIEGYAQYAENRKRLFPGVW